MAREIRSLNPRTLDAPPGDEVAGAGSKPGHPNTHDSIMRQRPKTQDSIFRQLPPDAKDNAGLQLSGMPVD